VIPARVEDLTPEWFSEVLDNSVRSVDILDAHSGTTGRARVRITASSDLPDTLFVKLQPFVEEQRKFLRQIGLGVAEARFYASVGNELPVRAPRVWHADHDASEGAFVMVLEDLEATGCRFPSPSYDDMLEIANSAMDELATLHAAYLGQELVWLRTPSGMRSKPEDPEMASRRAQFIVSALDQFSDDMPPVFRRLGDLYTARSLDIVALFKEGERTLIHGDTHSGNLFVDAGRTGFYDWAVAGRGSGMRDVARPVRYRANNDSSSARRVCTGSELHRKYAVEGARKLVGERFVRCGVRHDRQRDSIARLCKGRLRRK
jgi:hypothetical protein